MSARTILAIALACASGVALAQQQDDIGYPDVGTALAAVIETPGVVALDQPGWSMARAEDGEGRVTIWSFAKFSNPAYPTAVRRTISGSGASLDVETRIRCEAPVAACEAVRTEFDELERRLREHLGAQAAP